MAVEKTINIDGKDVKFRASAAIPRIYRLKFGKDIFKDFSSIQKSEDGELSIESLEVFENIAWALAKHADPGVPDDPGEWLEGFNIFSIYEILPELVELWGMNTQVQVKSKKNKGKAKES